LESIVKQLVSGFLLEEIREIEEDFWLINVSGVKISSDISYLDIYISSFKNSDTLAKTLAPYAPEITRKLHKSLPLRKLPKIRFRYDDSWEIGGKIIEKINSL
jgi:ribosome-binding factor A